MASSPTRLGPPIPLSDPIAKTRRVDKFRADQKDPQEGRVTDEWANYLTQFVAQTSQAPSRVASVQLQSQTASIAGTNLIPGNVQGGLYRLEWFAHITTADGVSSSLTVSASFTSNGNALTISGAAITGNTVTTYQTSGLQLFHSDDLAPIQFSTTYASGGGGPAMAYELYVVLEQIQ